ncbi:MAG: DUF438 domain-containing protein [Promethearchaeota archaeon]
MPTDLTSPEKREKLKNIILALHSGKTPAEMKEEFKKEFSNISPEEISDLEQELIGNGEIEVEQVTKLCDIHVEMMRDAINVPKRPETVPGHPVHTYLAENDYAKKLIQKLKTSFSPKDLMSLREIETHYTRLENQLFPQLEKVGLIGPSQVMWAKHDEIRELFKIPDPSKLQELLHDVQEMTYKEETILFPAAISKLTEKQWAIVKKGEEEIGFAWIKPGNEWRPITPESIHQTATPNFPESIEIEIKPNEKSGKTVNSVPVGLVSGMLNLQTGTLSFSQIDAIFRALPLDLSFINANDEVMYYSNTPDRIFPRSPGVIGRNVMNCHPPKSQHIVRHILDAFKANEKDVAEFWFTLNERFLHIRYFALHDVNKKYIGCLEFTQDVTDIRNLEGEQKLLNWEEKNSK